MELNLLTLSKEKQNTGLATTESLTITPAAAQADTKQISIKEQMLRYLNTYLPPDLQVTNFTTRYTHLFLLL